MPEPPLPYDITAHELGSLWLTEQCPEYIVFDGRYALTHILRRDQGVARARMQFYQKLRQGTLTNGRYDDYGYKYIPVDYFREAAEYAVGYDRLGFFLGSYVVHTRLNASEGTVTFEVRDPKHWESGSRSPLYYAPDLIGRLNPYLPEPCRVYRSQHNLEELVMGTQELDFPSDIFLAAVLRPRRRGEPGAFNTDIRTGGWIWLKFTWEEPLDPNLSRQH